MRVLVTGVAGYIGSVITEEIVARGHDVADLAEIIGSAFRWGLARRREGGARPAA
ncbi:NAD-dependent epimerase/dehydratase family protein [Sorangium sp. So ce117]|uniref:NAD-dependent epimerase/dehydratase family protein n=1 Tax=Sorangium sp. So ce117 TaxID=3133277 RepID=UPI003F63BEC8